MNNDPRMYVLMRTDLASMNAGKGMAQSHHAAMCFTKDVMKSLNTGVALPRGLEDWEDQTSQGFGTTITLAVPSEAALIDTVDIALKFGYAANVVLDPTYPVTDGAVTHLLQVYTCGYVFVPGDSNPSFLTPFSLHP